MERMAPEIRVVLQSVNAVTKHAHTDISETSQRSLLGLYCTVLATPRECRGIRRTVWEIYPAFTITQPFHLSCVPFVQSALVHHTSFFGVTFIVFFWSVSWFISIDGGARLAITVISSPQSRRRGVYSVGFHRTEAVPRESGT